MALRLRIPAQSEQLDPSLEVRKPYVEEWIEALPYINTLHVIRVLFDKLRDLNHAPLRPAHRLDLLEVFLPAVAMLEASQRHVAGGDTSSFERNRANTDGMRQLCSQLAYGYKLVLVRNGEGRNLFGGKRVQRLAAQRAMQTLALNLANAYHEYLPRLPHVWREMGEIHAHSVEHGFATAAAPAVRGSTCFSNSVTGVMVRITLLTLVDPLKLGPGELWHAYDWFGDVCATTTFVDAVQAPADGDGVIFDPLSDRPPGRLSASDDTVTGPAWYLDPAPAADALRALAADLDDPLRRALALRCADLMLHRRQRRAERVATDGVVEVARGMPALMHFSPTIDTAEKAPRQSDRPAGDGAVSDITTPFEPNDTATRMTPLIAPRYTTTSWQVVNRSAGGISLKRPDGVRDTILVGDLVGTRKTPNSEFAVGLTRWLSIAQPDDYRIGVELLASELHAVRIRPVDGDEQADIQAIMLPGRSGPGSMCLLTPVGHLTTGQVVVAVDSRARLRLRIGARLEAAGKLDLLACEAV